MMVENISRGRSSSRCEDNTLILPKQDMSGLVPICESGKMMGFYEHSDGS
jgi:hypothetical protein